MVAINHEGDVCSCQLCRNDFRISSGTILKCLTERHCILYACQMANWWMSNSENGILKNYKKKIQINL